MSGRTSWPDPLSILGGDEGDPDWGVARSFFAVLAYWVAVECVYNVVALRMPGAVDCEKSRRDSLYLNLLI